MARLLISLWKVQVKQMHIELTVKRQTVPDETSYLQTFSYDGDAALTIADWLTLSVAAQQVTCLCSKNFKMLLL